MADQFRADALAYIGGYGKTNALDSLVGQGVLFRRAVTNSPECMPARFALATGLYPHQSGVRRNGSQTMRPDAPSWIRNLAQAGYRTSLFGKSHFHQADGPHHDLRNALPLMRALGLSDIDEIAGPHALRHASCKMTDGWAAAGLLEPFREDMSSRLAHEPLVARASPLGAAHHYDRYVGSAARAYLESYNRPEPWFCWVSFAGPHEPWDAPAPYDTMHTGPVPPAIPPYPEHQAPPGLLENLRNHFPPLGVDKIDAIKRNYAGNVTLIDEQISGILEALSARGEDEQTLIIFVSDHGEMNGDHGLFYKSNFLAPAVNIPMIIRPPGPRRNGWTSDALVELIDAGATMLDYAGCAKMAGSNGRSLKPLIAGEINSHRDFVLSEYQHSSMVADARWKAEFDPSGEIKLLFDMWHDPAEQQNLAGAPEYKPQAQRLAVALSNLLKNSQAQIKIDQIGSGSVINHSS